MARRRRGLSAEDRELWRRVTATATALRPETVTPQELAPDPGQSRSVTKPLAAKPPVTLLRPRAPEPGRATVDLAPDPHAALARAQPHMDRTRFEKLRRGRMDPEARLDLHGMTSERAHAELVGFLLSAHAQGLRLVLIITGKGRSGDADALAPHRHGILRHSLPHWLAAPPLVAKILQVASAHTRHGGSGAYYVYLRRQR